MHRIYKSSEQTLQGPLPQVGSNAHTPENPTNANSITWFGNVDVVLFLRQLTTWVSPEIDYEREFQGGLGLFQLFWDILILISGLVSVSTQS